MDYSGFGDKAVSVVQFTRKRAAGMCWCVFLIASLVTVAAQDDDSPCPTGWVMADDNTCLQFNNQYQLPQGQAGVNCANQGAALLRFASIDEMESFTGLATEQAVDGWWSALSDSCNNPYTSRCTWTWGETDSVVPGSLAWATEPTDVHHVENCVTMDSAGLLSDDMCSNPFGYICTYTTYDICPGDDWTVVNDTCYYVSPLDDTTQLMTWAAAKNACAAFTPDSDTKPTLAAFNAGQFRYIQTLVAGVSPGGKRWVGMNDQFTERDWQWANHTQVSDTSFMLSQWHAYPDHTTGHSCGLVHSNGQMEQADCTLLRPFVCKKYIDLDKWLIAEDVGCPAPWIRGGRKCYYLNGNLTMDAGSARTFCNNMKGDLIKIESESETTWLSMQTVHYGLNNLWTGLQRSSTGSDTWVWADRSSADLEFIVWNQEPNDFGLGEDCAVVNTRGTFNDAACSFRASFICEMDTEDAPCPARWTSKASDDQTVCYYISTPQDNKATWQEARYKCQELAGVPDAHLVAIDSQDELDYLLTIVQKQPWAQYWTDLTDSSIEGYWQFSVSYMGTPPPIPWEKEPNNRGGNENCAVMRYKGRFADVPCTSKFYVACEKPAAGVTASGTGTALVTSSWASLVALTTAVLLSHFTFFVNI